MDNINKKKLQFNTLQSIIYGFMIVILMGTLLLMLPISSANGEATSFIDSLFTATTATCVTGLVVLPTCSYWSLFGKIVILILIQIGGLGVVCITMGLLIIIGRRISLRNRLMIQESYSLDSAKGMVIFIKRVLKGTIFVETTGAILYFIRFIQDYNIKTSIWYSVFHSVSAFCNAGIDIIGENSFGNYYADPFINIVTMMLIISGGIGFIVWWDLIDSFKNWKNKKFSLIGILKSLKLHSKVAITMTLLLILGGTLVIFIFEYTNTDTIGNLPLWQKIMCSLFESVTTRTAGFLTLPQENFRNASVMIICLLMFIGGSPMGTAGGIKTTTFAMILLTIRGVVIGKKDTEVYRRKINIENIKTGLAVTIISMASLFIAIMVLSITEDASMRCIIFEATSAIGTVGLSMGYTTSLSFAGKLIIIALMYIGRIGPISMVMAFSIRKSQMNNMRDLPEKKIIVG
ncbi:MAG: TrkH family potassium uptake protein [Eubacterium sp.]